MSFDLAQSFTARAGDTGKVGSYVIAQGKAEEPKVETLLSHNWANPLTS